METVESINEWMLKSPRNWNKFKAQSHEHYVYLWQTQVPTNLPESNWPEGLISINVKLYDTSVYLGCVSKVAIDVSVTGRPATMPDSSIGTVELSINSERFKFSLEQSIDALVKAWETLYG